MTNCTDLFAPAMDAVLQCAQQALTDCNRPPVGLAFVAPGIDIADDDCCNGQLWVRLINAAPYGDAAQIQACGPSTLAVTLGVGIKRCVKGMDDQGIPPTSTEMTADGHAMTADMSALLQSLMCCAKTATKASFSRIGSWTPRGPLGQCAGGEWQITLGLGTCGC